LYVGQEVGHHIIHGEDKMKLLAITRNNELGIAGYIETEEGYQQFNAYRNGKDTWFGPMCERRHYRDYLHFEGAIGKWDVFAILTKNPVEIKELTIDEIERVIEGRPDLTVSLQFTHY
jgi:hypothetical protein